MADKAKKRSGKQSQSASAGLDQAFTAAARAAQSMPASDEAWDHLEELAERIDRAEDAAAAYREALAQPQLDRDLRRHLGQRALRFHEAWFGDDPELMHQLLLPFIDGLADSEWALDRLTRVLTVAERWDALLEAYDRALARAQDGSQRQKLLDDAAHVAKDFAGQPERAIGYLEQLLLLDPGNVQRSAALERLLERCERIPELIALWRRQLAAAGGEPARALRVRIAATCLERLHDARAAVDELRALLDELPGYPAACEQLERVLAHDAVPAPLRLQAFWLLRSNYDAARRPEDALRVIEHAIELSEGAQQRDLRRDAGQRLAILERDREAMAHYAVLLAQDAHDGDARRALRRLAERSGLHDVHAAALVAAAEATPDVAQRASLRMQAAALQRDALGDTEAAIALYRGVLDDAELGARELVVAARELASLLPSSERPAERLQALERVAELEPSALARRIALGEAARLAERAGEPARALAAWRAQLAQDGRDREAIDACVRLLAQQGTPAERIEMLRARLACDDLPPELQRADLMRIAELQIEACDDLQGGIATLLEAATRFGVDEPMLRALDAAMSRAGRYEELAELMRRGVSDHHPRAAHWLARLGDIFRVELRMPERALGLYVQALSLEPRRAEARTGLHELAADASIAPAALEALARAHRELGEWEELVQLSEARVRHAPSDAQRARILAESARVLEEELGRPDAALDAVCRVFELDPIDSAFEAEMQRLGELTGRWADVARTYGSAASAAMHRNDVAVRLQYARARLLETRLADVEQALATYLAAFDWITEDRWGDRPIDPSPRMLLHAVTRCAAALGIWAQATDAAVHACCLLGAEEGELLGKLEAETSARDAWSAMCSCFAGALDKHRERMSDDLAYRLEIRLALWYRHRVSDLAAAEAMALRALERERSRSAGATLLCDIQRHNQSPALVDSLLRLDALDAAEAIASGARSLDLLYEAAERGLEQDRQRAGDILMQLYSEAARLLARGGQAAGQRSPASAVSFAVERLVELDVAQGRIERAVQVLLDAGKLPLGQEESRSHRARAAALLAERGQPERAVAIYEALVEEAPSELGFVHELVGLLQRLSRVPELIAAMRRELALTDDEARKRALRLRIAELIGEIEQDDGRLKMLQANLQSDPGHAETVDALSKLLIARGRPRDLAQVLTEQAAALGELGRDEQAAALLGRAADLYDGVIEDTPAAIAANERVVALAPSPERLATLARLCLAEQRPAQAAHWLAQRVTLVEEHERVAALMQLARAQLAAEQRDAALGTLEAAFAAAPKNAEVRKLLLAQHRARGDHEALARTLARAAAQLGDAETVIAYAREAAEIYRDRLGRPELALEVLEHALELAPEDRGLCLMLGEAQLAAGKLDEAKKLLARLIKGYGARRSAERAAAHMVLARVLQAKGDIEGALDELETAQRMAGSNIEIVRTLAELARDAGQLERAERAYRALLLLVRDPAAAGGSGAAAPTIGPGEVLMQLSWIAADLGQANQASERCESALEALVKSEADAQRVQRAVLGRGDHAFLRRVLETRLAAASSSQRSGEILAEYAALLADPIGDRGGSFERWLLAIDSHPAAPQYHAAALELARELGQLDRYAALLADLRERTNTPSQSYAQCEVLLRLGELAQAEDPARAAELYRAAEATGVREVDVWRAQASCAAALGDQALQLELLTRLANLGEQHTPDARADALYRLAEVQLAHEDSVSEGIATLARALDEHPRYERAGRILERACAGDAPDPDLLVLYERVAREGNDPALLLGFLERRARRADAVPEEIQEAVELAAQRGRSELAEELMLRAVEIAEELPDGRQRVLWALMGLADRRFEQRDLAAAVKWLLLASEGGGAEQVIARAARLATAAAEEGGDLTLAAKLYEQLLELLPTERAVWEPLADIYASLGDLERFERLVGSTLDGLGSKQDRAHLRMQHARLLIGQGEELERAAELLRAILNEDPRHAGAQDLLIEIVTRTGRPEDLQNLLEQHLAQAQAQSNAPAVRAAALRLGDHLRATGALAEELDVYREALPWLADDRELLDRLLRCLPESEADERARLLESLLASDPPEEAPAHALALAELHEQRGDAAAMLRVLELGRRRAPEDAQLVERLQAAYRAAGDHAGLAQLLHERAERETAPEARTELLLQAALLYREQLSQPAQAVALLSRAAELMPSDVSIASELAALYGALGRPGEAAEQLGRALSHCVDDERKAGLLRMRAEACMALGEPDAALSDLEQAFALRPEAVAPQLESFLEERRRAAHGARDRERERSATARLADVLLAQGKSAQARKALSEWLAREPGDRVALLRLCEVCAVDGDLLAVAETAGRLLAVAEGDELVEACRTLVGAASEIGRFDLARAGLETALRKQPDQAEFRAALKDVYMRTDAKTELAQMMLEDAARAADERERVSLLKQAGECLLAAGETAQAIQVLGDALPNAADDAELAFLLVDALIDAGAIGQANLQLDELSPKLTGRRLELAQHARRKARLAQATGDRQTQLAWLLEAGKYDKTAQLTVDIADLAEELEDWDTAERALRNVLLAKGDSPIGRCEIYVRQARIWMIRGDSKRALMLARKAQKEEPESAQVISLLEQLGAA